MKTKRKPVGWLKQNSPTILICISAIGVVATAVLAAKAAPKAKRLLEEAEAEKGEELTSLEKVKTAGSVYIPAAVTGVLTITCMFSANTLSRRTQAALSSAYALLDQSFGRYQKKVKEIFGEEAHDQIVGEILMEDAEKVSITANGFCSSSLDFGVTDEVERRFYDSFSGRAFTSTIEKVLQAEYHFNRNFVIGGGYADINQFYEFLGLAPIEGGGVIGWNCEEELYWIDFNHSITKLDDGFEYCIIDFMFDPTPLPEYR